VKRAVRYYVWAGVFMLAAANLDRQHPAALNLSLGAVCLVALGGAFRNLRGNE
jgi:hypothetical protein